MGRMGVKSKSFELKHFVGWITVMFKDNFI